MPLIGFLSMKYFLFAQLELSAVGLFSVLVVEISARALSGNGQWAGGKKKSAKKMYNFLGRCADMLSCFHHVLSI